MREADVTRNLKKFLSARNWTILSVHYPGSQAGMYIHSSKRAERGAKGSIILDLVARKGIFLLLIESKSVFDQDDVLKLVTLTELPDYFPDLEHKLELKQCPNSKLLRGIAIHKIDIETAKVQSDFFVFRVGKESIEVLGTFASLEDVKSLFPEYASFQ